MISQLRAIWWLILLLMLIGTPSWSVCDPDTAICRISAHLHDAELDIRAGSGRTTQAQLDTAVLALQVEEARLFYAKKLGLKAEGIASETEVMKARLAYEKSQLQLAAKRNMVKQALSAIQKQRGLADNLSSRYHAQLARRGDLPLQGNQDDIFY